MKRFRLLLAMVAMLGVLAIPAVSSAHCHVGPFYYAFIDCGG